VKRIASARTNTRCILIRYRADTRYDAVSVATHNGMRDADCVSAERLDELGAAVDHADFVFIDEGQFFPNLLDHCRAWALAGKEVHIAALDAYASQDLWPEIARVIPWAQTLLKLNAVCGQCGNDAPLTVRTDQPVRGGAETKIGGKDIYDASCIFCCDASRNDSHSTTNQIAAVAAAPVAGTAASSTIAATSTQPRPTSTTASSVNPLRQLPLQLDDQDEMTPSSTTTTTAPGSSATHAHSSTASTSTVHSTVAPVAS